VIMPATWSFDEMKRLSELKLLRGKDEDAQPSKEEDGRGLFKQIERENDQNIGDARNNVDQYKADAEKSINNFEKKMEDYQKDLARGRAAKKPVTPKLGPVPEIPPAKKVPDDVSTYIDFLHPWGSHAMDLGVLVLMFFTFFIATIIALKAQDV
jgi:hypothetical protein